MKIIVLILLFCLPFISNSQDIQWASKVLDYSTQFSGRDFAASKVIGEPDVLNSGGRDPNAWMASSPNEKEYIIVGFDSIINVKQIAIFESSNPGAIEKLFLIDEESNTHLIGSFQPRPSGESNRILNVFIPDTKYKVNALKIVTDGSRVSGTNSIDAIAISRSVTPIVFRKGFAYRTNPRLNKSRIDLEASTGESDIRPVYSADEKALFFTRGFSESNVGGIEDPGDVWYAEHSSGNRFRAPVRLGEDINNVGFNTSNSYYESNNNPRLMVGNVTGKSTKVKANLTAVEKEDDEWKNATEQKIKSSGINAVDADYTITSNGEVLIISAERSDSKGGTDLYISFNEGNNKWTSPKSLTGINTSEDDYAPFYSTEEQALYFSSSGYSGLGGNDIFRTRRLDASWENWSPPENIGPDINTVYNDHYFYFDEGDSYAYLAQANKNNVMGIVRIERPKFLEPNPLVVLSGKVLDEQESIPVNAVLSLLLVPENKLYGVTFSDEKSGDYQISLRSGYQYKLIGERKGYETVELPLDLKNKNQEYTYDLNILLSKDLAVSEPDLVDEVRAMETLGAVAVITDLEEPEEEKSFVAIEESTETITEITAVENDMGEFEVVERTVEKSNLQNLIAFAFNSDLLQIQSYEILDAIVSFMLNHQELKLEIGGFTDYIGDYYYNKDLSVRRAYSVKQYLSDNGVQESRIRVIGFGEDLPIVSSLEVEKAKINRRAEFNFTR